MAQLGSGSLFVEAVNHNPTAGIGSETIAVSLDVNGDQTADGNDIVRMTPLIANVAVDNDRDGKIEYAARDFTSAEKPFHFWLNNNNDIGVVEPGWFTEDQGWIDATEGPVTTAYGDATDALIGPLDSPALLGNIVFQRDLEDFAATALRYSAQVEASDLADRVEFAWTGTTGALRLWRGYFSDFANPASNAHVQEGDVIEEIFERTSVSGRINVATPNSSLYLEANKTVTLSMKQYRDLFAKAEPTTTQNGIKTVPLLFEAQKTGEGALRVRFINSAGGANRIVSESQVKMSLKSIKEFYEWHTVGDQPRGDTASDDPKVTPVPTTSSFTSGQNARVMSLTDDYIMFVHGWRMTLANKRAFAATSYKRLFWSGYRGTMGAFSWPTPHTNHPVVNSSNFNQSEEVAWHSAAGLRSTIQSVDSRYQGKITLLAHSMGNVVSSEALYLSGSVKLVDTYIASNAALSAHYFNNMADPELSPGVDTDYWIGVLPSSPGTPMMYKSFASVAGVSPRFSNLKSSGSVLKMLNYFKTDDYATSFLWEQNNAGRSRIAVQDLSHGFGDFEYVRGGNVDTGSPVQLVRWPGWGLQAVQLTEAANRYEVYAHLFASRAKSLGATNTNPEGDEQWGEFDGSFNLGPNGLNLGSATNGHSRQWFSSYNVVGAFWQQVVSDAK